MRGTHFRLVACEFMLRGDAGYPTGLRHEQRITAAYELVAANVVVVTAAAGLPMATPVPRGGPEGQRRRRIEGKTHSEAPLVDRRIPA